MTDLSVGRTLTFGTVCVTALRSSTLSVHSRDLLECRVSNDRESNILGPSKLWTDLSSRDPPDIIEPCLLILNRTVCCCGYRALQMTRFLEPFSRSVPLAVWKGSGTQANHLACFPMGTVLAIEAASARQSHGGSSPGERPVVQTATKVPGPGCANCIFSMPRSRVHLAVPLHKKC